MIQFEEILASGAYMYVLYVEGEMNVSFHIQFKLAKKDQ